MNTVFYKYLISHGITNIVEIDGLLYAAVSELTDLHLSCYLIGFFNGIIVVSLLDLFLPKFVKFIRSIWPR